MRCGGKAACRSRLHDTTFDPSLQAYCRRLAARLNRISAVRQVVEATGVLKNRQRRALDSTVPTMRWPPRKPSPS